MSDSDKAFSGSIPKIYESHLVPLIFEPYAVDLVNRLKPRALTRVLEIGAGTGVVTRRMAAVLDPEISIVATDLNPAMLEQATASGTKRNVEWRQADAMQLPFPDQSFDAVVCQFTAMFFPDKPAAYSEAMRVLKPGGVFLFNVWDRIEENEFADIVAKAVASLFPDDPPGFLARTPYAFFDCAAIVKDLAKGGFKKQAVVTTVPARSKAESAQVPALAYCQGTPLRTEIEARDAGRLDEATQVSTTAIAQRFGDKAVDAKIQAHVFEIER